MTDQPKITKEDQGFINEFSRYHQKNKVIDAELKVVSQRLANLKDAAGRVDELFGENAKILVGETFVEMADDKAAEIIENLLTKNNNLKKEKEDKYASNKKRLDELKIILYSKFRNTINLDE